MPVTLARNCFSNCLNISCGQCVDRDVEIQIEWHDPDPAFSVTPTEISKWQKKGWMVNTSLSSLWHSSLCSQWTAIALSAVTSAFTNLYLNETAYPSGSTCETWPFVTCNSQGQVVDWWEHLPTRYSDSFSLPYFRHHEITFIHLAMYDSVSADSALYRETIRSL